MGSVCICLSFLNPFSQSGTQTGWQVIRQAGRQSVSYCFGSSESWVLLTALLFLCMLDAFQWYALVQYSVECLASAYDWLTDAQIRRSEWLLFGSSRISESAILPSIFRSNSRTFKRTCNVRCRWTSLIIQLLLKFVYLGLNKTYIHRWWLKIQQRW